MTDPRTALVGAGYDVIADRFVEWRDRIVGDPRQAWVDDLMSRLPYGARVLELGCGAGVPDTRTLAERFEVTGVDISAEQISRAGVNAQTARLVHADFTSLELEPASFEAVTAFYAFNHVPRELIPGVFARINSWLTPGGLFLSVLGTGDDPGWTGEWMGAQMFFSSFPPEENRRLFGAAGFELVRDELVTLVEPDGEATFQWVLARR